jgi:hypothetical protein
LNNRGLFIAAIVCKTSNRWRSRVALQKKKIIEMFCQFDLNLSYAGHCMPQRSDGACMTVARSAAA